jgi:puromycin-sensitive aminopeptidase
VIFSQERDGAVEFERLLLEGDNVDVSLWEPIDWILANTEGTGFYRVQYAPDLLSALTSHLGQLSAIERYTLIDDQWALLLASLSAVEEFIGLAERYADDTDLSVWQRLVGTFASLDRIADEAGRGELRGFVRGMVEPALLRLGRHRRDGDDDRTRQLRGVLFETLGVLAHDEVTIDQARVTLGQDLDALDPALLASAINTVAANGTMDDYERFVEGFRNASTPQEELRYLSALADFPDAALMQRTLDMTLTDEVRTQNAPYLLRRALTNRDLGAMAWTFVKDNWAEINDRFPSNSIVRMLEGIRSLSQPQIADDVFAFFSEQQVPQGDRVLAQHLERLQVNVALRQREGPQLGGAFG